MDDLTPTERRLLGDLFAIIDEQPERGERRVDRDLIAEAFRYACVHDADQRRKSREDLIVHRVKVAKICVGMHLDTETLCAVLLHDSLTDTSASLEGVEAAFGEHIAALVDGVTKLSGVTYRSRDEAHAENYRKMIVAMASDIRVIVIKLADCLHNMRTIGAMPKDKQIERARETLDIYAPIVRRLGIRAIEWELEDLAFQTLHPRKYGEIKGLVAQQRFERERYVNDVGACLAKEFDELGIVAEISGRAKHFYSIYVKMTKKGREFNEIYDLTAMRVIVGSVKDCYCVVGVIHSLWKPLPGRFKDFIAMPKFNMYQSLHTIVIGPEGRPLEIQIRTREMHEFAEFGLAARWDCDSGSLAKRDPVAAHLDWLNSRVCCGRGPCLRSRTTTRFAETWQRDPADTNEVDRFVVQVQAHGAPIEEVLVLTPRAKVISLPKGGTVLDFAYHVHTDLGHRCVGAKVQGQPVRVSYQLRTGDVVEILTSPDRHGPTEEWLTVARSHRARKHIKAWAKSQRKNASR